VVLVSSSCTTYVQPVLCEGKPYRCIEALDVAFCEYVAVSVEGSECDRFNLGGGKPFCIVTHDKCPSTNYAVKGRDCRIVKYTAVREWRECSAGTPTFTAE
jgi:hypothetical protein